MVYEVLLVAYLIVALVLVGFVLIQQGKGADMGASFGSGGSNTMFGSSGSGNFMTRTTGILATLFFLISLILGNLTANREKATDSWSDLTSGSEASVPAQQPAEQSIDEQTVPGNTDVPVNSDIPVSSDGQEKGDTPN
ncbi:preprotein translocase subunit SecG [Salinimonas marina]|uniref:Protein-export membrane protein SecG n=1 Tax=Salinimonas marina TaxID=2785918 RepID=A0A7S9HBN5_9ALTE|nr:preprotein translocase subunit SecG [Salinimonas marina]QPG04386.1 preprotein translocase subunit SecG [Salinimonas marina]